MKSVLKTLGIVILSIIGLALLFLGLAETSSFFRSNDYKLLANIIFMMFPILLYFLVILFNRKVNKLNFNEIGFGYKNIFKGISIGLFLTVGVIMLSLLIAKFIFKIEINFVELKDGFKIPLIDMLSTMFLVGLWEEFFFRGLVFNTMKKNNFGLHGAIIVSSLLFSIIHWSSFDMSTTSIFWYLAIFLIGYIYAIIYKITNSIWSVVAAHAAWDFFASLIDAKVNKIGLIAVNDYALNAKTIDNIQTFILFLTLIILLYFVQRKKIKLVS